MPATPGPDSSSDQSSAPVAPSTPQPGAEHETAAAARAQTRDLANPAQIRLVATTAAERRVARVLAMEPGGRPTLSARIANRVIKSMMKTAWQYGPETDAGLIRIRRATDLMARLEIIPRGVAITPQDLGTCTAEWVRAGAPDDSKALLYLHGGGYFFGSPRLYRPFNWRLSASTRRSVLALDYRLAPHHTPADALEDALGAYDYLLAQGYEPSNIVVGGDSAGGHLTLALLLALKQRGGPLPESAFALSPWVDLLCQSQSHQLNRQSDSLIPAGKLAWLGREFCRDKEENDPLFSPLRADLSGLPPLLFIASSTEILRDETRDVAERARAAGVPAVYQEWDGLVHVFPVFADYVPEGKAAFRHIAEFIQASSLGGPAGQ
ncbi:alpha/beta hydrolase [Actinomadura barringtoniae]|uniref:Alpha/beta hydrolase n=1 Tax=Actinomadura barringtoniae TaxID=1427535 RepID=A0A939T5A4_9ACTN|nr:alpha/beta hydrolase [Actinomadura barringtoniae]MBO2446872.1 alpha/beta hydrolase [Actinomadura barringtoniae]